jgi:hypothetical protein
MGLPKVRTCAVAVATFCISLLTIQSADAQVVTYPPPGGYFGTAKATGTFNSTTTFIGNCGGATGSSSSGTDQQLMLPPFGVQGSTLRFEGINWLPLDAGLPANVLQAQNNVSLADGFSGSDSFTGIAYTETYSVSVSGLVVTETWNGNDEFIFPAATGPEDDTDKITVVSTYNIKTGEQNYSYKTDSVRNRTPSDPSTQCGNIVTATFQDTGCFNWQTGQQQQCSAPPPPCNVNPHDVVVFAGPPYSNRGGKGGGPTTMNAQFTPRDTNGDPLGLDTVEKACGYVGFNWQQQITALPAPSPFAAAKKPSVPLVAPPQFYDPPPGGYTGGEYTDAPPHDSYPFYYLPDEEATLSVGCTGQFRIENDDTLAMQDCPFDTALTGDAKIAFMTSLVGVLPGNMAGPPLKTWTWTSNFNGTAKDRGKNTGGVQLQTLSLFPVDPNSGNGGVVITSIDGVTQTPPSVSCFVTPNTLWPPNGSTVPITVSGQITAGTQASGTTTFLVTDSQSSAQQNGTVTPQSNGAFSFTVPLVSSRAGNIQSGRQYTIAVTANDSIGNQGSCSAVVTVPHDQGN